MFDPQGRCISSALKEDIDLQKTIPGFCHGVQGMRVGERREIYIHPALAYGVHTYLEKGIYLKVVIQLLDLLQSNEVMPALSPLDLSFVCDEEFQKTCEETYKKCFACLGTSRSQF